MKGECGVIAGIVHSRQNLSDCSNCLADWSALLQLQHRLRQTDQRVEQNGFSQQRAGARQRKGGSNRGTHLLRGANSTQ